MKMCQFYLRLLVSGSLLILLSGCGSNEPPSSIDLNTSDNGNTTDTNTGTNSTYCTQNTPVPVSSEGNVYRFDVLTGECLGISEDSSFKKTIPLTIDEIRTNDELTFDPDFSIDSTIRLYLHKTGRSINGFVLNMSVDIANNSNFDYCYRIGSVTFEDLQGNGLTSTSSYTTARNSALYQTSSEFFAPVRRKCLPANSSLNYVISHVSVSEETFNSIESASIGYIGFSALDSRHTLSETLDIKMQWLQPGLADLSSYPTLFTTWTNTSSGKIQLDKGYQWVWFFDEQGYALSSSNLSLGQALGMENEELTEEDLTFDANESFVLIDKIADNAAVTPSHATTARIYPSWTPVE